MYTEKRQSCFDRTVSDSTDISFGEKIKCFIQFGFASLNRTFNFSLRENICTTTHITIHYLFTM